jgi:uncharacterized protein
MKFWDASAIVGLCLEQPATPQLTELARSDQQMAVWWATPIECASAFARLAREGALTTREREGVRATLQVLQQHWFEILPSEALRSTAMRLLFGHTLRAADATQLAAALVWANKDPQGHEFVCLDDRLRDAAEHEGFTAMPPG